MGDAQRGPQEGDQGESTTDPQGSDAFSALSASTPLRLERENLSRLKDDYSIGHTKQPRLPAGVGVASGVQHREMYDARAVWQ